VQDFFCLILCHAIQPFFTSPIYYHHFLSYACLPTDFLRIQTHLTQKSDALTQKSDAYPYFLVIFNDCSFSSEQKKLFKNYSYISTIIITNTTLFKQSIIHFKSQNGCLLKFFLVVSHSSMSRNRNLTFILSNANVESSFIII